MDASESIQIFDEDYSDSDGDGFSNIFERSMGLDSLGPRTLNIYRLKLKIQQMADREYLSSVTKTHCKLPVKILDILLKGA